MHILLSNKLIMKSDLSISCLSFIGILLFPSLISSLFFTPSSYFKAFRSRRSRRHLLHRRVGCLSCGHHGFFSGELVCFLGFQFRLFCYLIINSDLWHPSDHSAYPVIVSPMALPHFQCSKAVLERLVRPQDWPSLPLGHSSPLQAASRHLLLLARFLVLHPLQHLQHSLNIDDFEIFKHFKYFG